MICAEKLPAEGRKVPTREYIFSLRTLLFFQLASSSECLLHACAYANSLHRKKCTVRIISQQRGKTILPTQPGSRCPKHSSGWAQPGKKTSWEPAPSCCSTLCWQWESVPSSRHGTHHTLPGETCNFVVPAEMQKEGYSFQPCRQQQKLQAWGRARTQFTTRKRRFFDCE